MNQSPKTAARVTPMASLGRFGLFILRFAREAIRRPPPPGRTLAEAYAVGVAALPILLIIAAFVGTNLAIQGYTAFQPIGGQRMVGLFVALTGVREFGPIIAASMVAAKSGTEMASQIAVMRIRDQIDALEVMAVQPHWYLVTPRLLGILLAMPAVTTLSTFTMVSAAYLVSVYQLDLNGATFMEFALTATSPIDLLVSNVKAVLFGGVICLVSCYNGFISDPGPEGVGASTNRAVVLSAVSCVILNYLISEAIY